MVLIVQLSLPALSQIQLEATGDITAARTIADNILIDIVTENNLFIMIDEYEGFSICKFLKATRDA